MHLSTISGTESAVRRCSTSRSLFFWNVIYFGCDEIDHSLFFTKEPTWSCWTINCLQSSDIRSWSHWINKELKWRNGIALTLSTRSTFNITICVPHHRLWSYIDTQVRVEGYCTVQFWIHIWWIEQLPTYVRISTCIGILASEVTVLYNFEHLVNRAIYPVRMYVCQRTYVC